MRRLVISVTPPDLCARYARFLEPLEALFPIVFRGRSIGSARGCDAALLIGGTRADALALAEHGAPCLAVISASAGTAAPAAQWVRFGNSNVVPHHFRGRTLRELRSENEVLPLSPRSGEIVVAARDTHAIWLHRESEGGRGPIDLASTPLPVPGGDFLLAEHFGRDRFIALLPMLHFLRRLTANLGWTPSAPRACFVFDDLNLRWRSYGCVDFRELAQHARERRYHAAVAIIPLDAARVQADTAALFREYPEQLSLVIHGNNHVWLELARDRPEVERVAALAQARRRMAEFEPRHRLPVCAVAEPPYGVIRSDHVPALVALQYEAVLLTLARFPRFNGCLRQPPEFGLHAAECLPGGLALVPRIRAAPGWETEVVLAAFLGQPIVIAGHHFDADDDLNLLEQVASLVNEMGAVAWSNLSAIARSRFVVRREGSTLRIRAASRRIVVPVPEGIDEVVVERPWMIDGDTDEVRWAVHGDGAAGKTMACGRSATISVPGVGLVEILSPVRDPLDPADVPPPHPSLWPLVRRAITETRDRCYPFLPRPLRRHAVGS
jgi:hypothetical protein